MHSTTADAFGDALLRPVQPYSSKCIPRILFAPDTAVSWAFACTSPARPRQRTAWGRPWPPRPLRSSASACSASPSSFVVSPRSPPRQSQPLPRSAASSLARSSAMRRCASFEVALPFPKLFHGVEARGYPCGHQPVSQLVFASTASESVVAPSTPSMRRVPRFSEESGSVSLSGTAALVSAQTRTRPPRGTRDRVQTPRDPKLKGD